MIDTKLSEFQNRIFGWQRDVAGQPVTLDGDNPDMSFYPKQLSFVESEWFDEYIPHSSELNRMCSEYTLTLRGVTTLVPTAIDVLRMDLADDIADVSFTLFGLLNVLGQPVLQSHFNDTRRFGVSHYERVITASIYALKKPNIDSPNIITNALVNLNAIAFANAIDFFIALDEVCRSNDTKLWMDEELERGIPAGCSVTLAVQHVPGERCYRVTNENGKLIKSPSFQKPNMAIAIRRS